MISFIWRSLSLGELTPMIFNMKLTHLGLEASKYNFKLKFLGNDQLSLEFKITVIGVKLRPPRKSGLTPKTIEAIE